LAEKSNQHYALSKILNSVILGTLIGMNRLIKIENFTLDPLIRHLLAIEDKLDIYTIRYYINKFGMKQNSGT